jgi:hypothetical protein
LRLWLGLCDDRHLWRAIDRRHQPIDEPFSGDVIAPGAREPARDRARLVPRIPALVATGEVLGMPRNDLAIAVDDRAQFFGDLFTRRHL